MNSVTSIAEHLERLSVRSIESTIPEGMTIKDWRRHPSRGPTPTQTCGHLHDTTTRYDHDRKLLHFLLVCPTCGTEKVVDTQRYEPSFTPHQSAGATIHRLPVRRGRPRRLRRAA